VTSTSVESGEVRLELVVADRGLVVGPFAGSEWLRRVVQDGWLRALGIVGSALFVAGVYEPSFRQWQLAAGVSVVSWLLAVQLTERSLRTVRAVAGRVGLAAFSALGGLVFASGLSFWLLPVVAGRAEVLSMTALVFAVVFAAEAGKVRVSVLRSRVLLVGGGRTVHDLVELVAQDERSPFTIVGVVDDEPAVGGAWLGPVAGLQQAIAAQKPDLVVVAALRGRPEVFAALADIAKPGFRVVGLPEFHEHAFARVPAASVTDAWFMSVLHLYQRTYNRIAKRCFDVIVASLGLLLTAPLFPIIALLVRRTAGPILYRQTRLGEHGQEFSILKFRTMTDNAETNGAVWAQEADPRITATGRFLRRTRLDEIPQLINVLRGDMAIVGPRPERPEFLHLLQQTVPYWTRRNLIKPGITGWAQLKSGYAADSQATEQKLAYDLWYLRHQSLTVDILISARTIPTLLLANGR
jgi:exopolysaccharide biosynthesis polyprenyl glycosylphosphotransferase